MGSRMAAHLARAGHELIVYNRTPAVAERWTSEHGGKRVDSPIEIRADVVFTMLVDGPQVEQALLGPAGAAVNARPETVFVDMSTIGPLDRFVEAPVTGSSPKAEDGTLTIIVGGSEAQIQRVQPLLESMGSLIIRGGGLGDAQTIKLINNAVAAANASTLAQALLVGDAAGIDLGALIDVMKTGSGGSAMVDLKAEAMRRHDWTPLFKLEHMLKDVDLCLETSAAAGAPFAAAEAVRAALATSRDDGLGDADFAALLTAHEATAGRRL
jgi:3-hydroxyisobutyrate dehydrogenase-like beta-hydroxyacid dehydrogenase